MPLPVVNLINCRYGYIFPNKSFEILVQGLFVKKRLDFTFFNLQSILNLFCNQ